jgi:hypothetical protein
MRPLNHFFDPINDIPLTVPDNSGDKFGERSPDWALEDRKSIEKQEFSYRHAREYLYLGVTDRDRNIRNENMGGEGRQAVGPTSQGVRDQQAANALALMRFSNGKPPEYSDRGRIL